MKKKMKLALCVLCVCSLLFVAGCANNGGTTPGQGTGTTGQTDGGGAAQNAAGSGQDTTVEKEKIIIGCFPSTQPLPNLIKSILEEYDYEVEIKLFDGNQMPAEALNAKELDIISGNHQLWIETFNANNNGKLVMAEPYFYFYSALYSLKYDSVDDIPDNAVIAVPNDPSNVDRCLKIMEDAGLLKLSAEPLNGNFYSAVDILENPKNLTFLESDVTTVAANLGDVDAAVASSVLVMEAGYDPHDFLAFNRVSELSPQGVVVHEDSLDAPWLKLIRENIHNEEAYQYLSEAYAGTAVPLSQLDAFLEEILNK